MIYFVRPLATFVLAATLAACGTTPVVDSRGSIPVETQRAIYAECAKQKGVLHWIRLHKLKSRNGRLIVLGSDGSGVTVGEAQGINKCASEKMDVIIASGAIEL